MTDNAMEASYLDYAKRGYGQDHDLYDWQLSRNRAPVRLDAKVLVSFVVPLEFFPLNPSGVPFKHPGAMATPYPDLRHYTVRDYGNRVGVFRILDALGKTQAGFAVQAEVARRYPPLMAALGDHEVIAHGVSTDHIQHEGMPPEDEAELIAETLASLPDVSGWLSPARTQSSRTLELVSEAGLAYCLDWENDQVPVKVSTGMTLLPNSYELSDFTLLHIRRQKEESWLAQLSGAVEYLTGEYDRYGTQCLTLTLTPYVIGQPFRIWALRALLEQLNAREDVSILTPGAIVTQFEDAT